MAQAVTVTKMAKTVLNMKRSIVEYRDEFKYIIKLVILFL